MEKRLYKGRERLVRGRLKTFEDLPIEVQNDFKIIKETIIENLGRELDVFVFGSYNHGNWDELSDYDVIINENPLNVNLPKLTSDKLGRQVHVLATPHKVANILIP